MTYQEFKESILKAWRERCRIYAVHLNDKNVISHQYHLWVNEKAIFFKKNHHYTWDEMEKMVEEGRWNNHQEYDGSTIVEIDGEVFGIKVYKHISLDELL